jgi:hypothetical protein
MIKHLSLVRVISLALASISMLVSDGMAQEARREAGLINDVDQAAVAFHPATPYLETSTLLLADINLEKLDVVETGRWLHQFAGLPKNDPATEMIRGFVDSMQGAGVSHLFATLATRSLIDGGPVVVVPCENPAVVNGLATVLLQQLPKEPPQGVHVGDKIVLAGATTAIDRVTKTDGVERPDLILPLRAGDRLDHTVVVALPDQSRDELAAFWPYRLPQQWPVQFSPRSMVRDISNVVVSWRLPPNPEMLVRIETTDASAVERVKGVLEKMLALAGDAKRSVEMEVDLATLKLRATPETFVEVASRVAAPSRKRAKRVKTMNSMKHIGLAIHNYHSKQKHLPPRCFTDREGRPLLSWRVALLPHVEQLAFYRIMELDKPWDDENNWMHSKTIIPVYCLDPDLRGKTTIRAPVFPGSLWHGEGPPKKLKDVTDGTAMTIAAIDAPESAAIEWSNPQPWVLSAEDPMSDVFGDRETAVVLLLDGAALALQKSEMTNEKLKAMLTIAGGETIE